MSTLQQQLAEAIAARQASAGMVDAMRTSALSELDRMASLWNAPGMIGYGSYVKNQGGMVRYLKDNRAVQSAMTGLGSIRSSIESDQLSAQQAVEFLTSDIRGNQGSWSMRYGTEPIRTQFFTGLESSMTNLRSAESEISRINQLIEEERRRAQEEQESRPPQGQQATSDPQSPVSVSQMQSENRSRVRSDMARLAFGTPRFGVGLNIPLGT